MRCRAGWGCSRRWPTDRCPPLVMAATERLYVVPLVSPVRVSLVDVELKVWLTAVPLGTGVAVTL